jgi:hypothetical protein
MFETAMLAGVLSSMVAVLLPQNAKLEYINMRHRRSLADAGMLLLAGSSLVMVLGCNTSLQSLILHPTTAMNMSIQEARTIGMHMRLRMPLSCHPRQIACYVLCKVVPSTHVHAGTASWQLAQS